MWFEIGMRYIDGLPYYPIFDVLAIVFFAVVMIAIVQTYECRKQRERIEELENLVDYYYNEDLIK